MKILDGIVEWIAEQVMNILDLITTSVLGALGCSMDTFLRYFPAAESMYQIFLALAIGLILLNWVWQLFKNYFVLYYEVSFDALLYFFDNLLNHVDYCVISLNKIHLLFFHK